MQDVEQSKEQIKLQMASIDSLLIRAFHFTSKDILTLHKLIDGYNIQYDVPIEKIIYLDEHIKKISKIKQHLP